MSDFPNWPNAALAIHGWVVAASGLAATQVIWSQQEGDRPVGQYIDINFSGITEVGIPVHTVEESGASTYNMTRGFSNVVCTLRCFGGRQPLGSMPMALLSKVVLLANSPSNQARFAAATIGYLSAGAVLNVSAVLQSAKYENRATVDCRFNMPFQVAEVITSGGWIESVEISGLIPSGDETVPVTDGRFYVVPPES